MNVGLKLKQYADKVGMSQYKLAKTSGLSQPFIGKLFKGEKSPSLASLEKLCSALGITLAEFFAEEGKTNPKESQLLSAYRRLNDDKQDTAITIVEALANN